MNNVNILLNMNVEIFLIADAVLGIILCGGLLLWGWGWSPLPFRGPNTHGQVRTYTCTYVPVCVC
jgi:hypothetical protein